MRLDDELRGSIRNRLQAWPVQRIDAPGLHHAAVVLTLVDAGFGAGLPGFASHAAWSDDAALLLTRRAARLNRHAGQWSLPGGRIDAGESPTDAALRELQEELGLVLDAGAVLGVLDDYATRSGYVITPIVAWGGATAELRPDPAEVARVHRIPLAELLRDDAPILDAPHPAASDPAPPHRQPGQPVLRMPLGERWVAAPTAAVLYQFREVCLLDRPTRVAHFDQPRFTWR